MARTLLKRPNLLAYPGGLPGFDPAHPAATKCRLSVISSAPAASYVSLMKAATPSYVSATLPTAKIDGVIGPATVHITGGGTPDSVFFVNTVPAASYPQFTAAGIFRLSTAGGIQFPISDGNNNQNFTFSVGDMKLYLAAQYGAPFAPAVNVPYFYAVSLNTLNTTMHVILRNLITGAVQTFTTTSMTSTEVSSGGSSYFVGSANSFQLKGAFAAGMVSHGYLTMQQLQQWADDPWAFWYPQKLDLIEMLGLSIAPSLVPYNPWPQAAPLLAQ